MNAKLLETINKADIEALVEHEVPESALLEYKEALPGNSADDRKEFLADIASFANASGGDLLYGVREKRDAQGRLTGLPEAIQGLAISNLDHEKLRLENMLRDSVEPQVHVHMHLVEGFPGGPVLILRVPQSLAAPHMLRGSPRFFSRNSSGKYPLDVSEIRQAFLLSESIEERIRAFRIDRVERILNGATAVPIEDGPKAVLHVVPVAAMARHRQFSIDALKPLSTLVVPWYGSPPRPRFEGLVLHPGDGRRPQTFCVTFFWNGAIELILGGFGDRFEDSDVIAAQLFEKQILDYVPRLLGAVQQLALGTPILLLLTLVHARGFIMGTDYAQMRQLGRQQPIDSYILFLPEVFIEDFAAELGERIKPALDRVWHAVGIEKSPFLDERGNWIGKD